MVAVVLLLFILLILVTLSFVSTSESTPTKRICKGDGFDQVTYTILQADGMKINKSIRLKFVDDALNDEYYNFEAAKTKCIELESNLWEIADGQAEWDAVIEIAKKEDKASIWLNANTTNSHCPGIKSQKN